MNYILIVELITSIIFAIPTLIIGGIVAYIGYLQYQTNKRQQLVNEEKFKLDLFDKRYKVFEATRYLFMQIIQSGDIDQHKIREFSVNTTETVFLFDDEIRKYLKKVLDEAVTLQVTNMKYKDLPVSSKRSELCEKQGEITKWFHGQYSELQEVFAPYLKFKEWKGN
ncbi:MAG: hypothetical protein ACUZ8I_15295 [Candidatus Scalindua sp.]